MKNTEQKPPSDFEVMADFNRLYSAYLEARKGKRWKYAVVRFEVNLLENLMALHFLLTSRKYRPSPYNYFLVHEPKERLIMYNGFRDKIIQHSLCDNVLEPRLAKTFILDNYASQKGKGTHFGLDRLKAFMQRYPKGRNLRHQEDLLLNNRQAHPPRNPSRFQHCQSSGR